MFPVKSITRLLNYLLSIGIFSDPFLIVLVTQLPGGYGVVDSALGVVDATPELGVVLLGCSVRD